MATYTATSTNNQYVTLVLTVTESSYSTANNTSTLSWSLDLKKSSASTASSSWRSIYSCTINGTSVLNVTSYTTVAVAPGASVNLGSGTLTVSHNTDGSKAVSVSAAISPASSGGHNASLSGTFTCTTIPRASSITSASNVTMGSACSIKWTPASSSFTYKLKFVCGSGSYTTGTISPATTAAYTYTGYAFPTATWAPYITSATSATVTATLTTYSGTTAVGTATKTFTLTVPASVVPTVSISVAPATTYISTYKWLVGYSKPVVTITKSGTYSSTITKVSTTFNSQSSTSASSVTFTAPTAAGAYTVSTTVTDSRGRTATASTSITYVAYTAPTLTSISAIRASTTTGTEDSVAGTYGYLSFKYTLSSVSSKNSGTVTVKYKASTASVYTTLSTTTISAGGTYTATKTGYFAAATTNSYTVQITAADAVTSVTKTVTIPSAFALIHFCADGTGMSIGKVDETPNQFGSGLPMAIDGRITSANDNMALRHNHPTSGNSISFGVGVGGINRGIYDNTTDEWLLYYDGSYLRSPKKVAAQGITIPQIQHGNVSITVSAANTPTGKAVTFPTAFGGAPTVVVTAISGAPGTLFLGASAYGRSSTGVTIYVNRTNTGDTTVCWQAMY